MAHITLDVDDQVIRRAEKVATDRNTTVPQMVQEFLQSVAAGDTADREQARQLLAQSFARLSRDMGPHRWSREDLYE